MPPSSLFGSKLNDKEREILIKQTQKGGRNKRNKKRKTRKKCRSSFFLRSLRKKTRQRGGGDCDRKGWKECNASSRAQFAKCEKVEQDNIKKHSSQTVSVGNSCRSDYLYDLANCDDTYFCS